MTDEIIIPYYASISRRFLALVLDFLILMIPAFIMGAILPVIGGLVAYFLYAPFLESSVLRATVGKKLMGIQVNDVSGSRVSFRAAMMRSLVKLISSTLLFIPHLLALFTQRRQALHDLVAETVVVYGRVEVPVADAWMESIHDVFGFRERHPKVQVSGAETGDKLTDLERLQSLFERGALNREEFDAEKKKILER